MYQRLWNATAAIDKRHPEPMLVAGNANRNGAGVFDSFDGIAEKVKKNLVEFGGIRINRRHVIVFDGDGDPRLKLGSQ
jgi:hypothetical protein